MRVENIAFRKNNLFTKNNSTIVTFDKNNAFNLARSSKNKALGMMNEVEKISSDMLVAYNNISFTKKPDNLILNRYIFDEDGKLNRDNLFNFSKICEKELIAISIESDNKNLNASKEAFTRAIVIFELSRTKENEFVFSDYESKQEVGKIAASLVKNNLCSNENIITLLENCKNEDGIVDISLAYDVLNGLVDKFNVANAKNTGNSDCSALA